MGTYSDAYNKTRNEILNRINDNLSDINGHIKTLIQGNDEKIEAFKRIREQMDFDVYSIGMLCGNGFEIKIRATVNNPNLLNDEQFIKDCTLLFGEYDDED